MYKFQKLFSCYNITIKTLLLHTKYILNLETFNFKTLRIFLASEIFILVGMKNVILIPVNFLYSNLSNAEPNFKMDQESVPRILFI